MTADSAHFALLFVLSVAAASGQIIVKLQPRTIEDFDKYAGKVEDQLSLRWHGQPTFLTLDDSQADMAEVLNGRVLIRPSLPDNPIPISSGLIHDWLGDVFIPNATVDQVLTVLQDFNHHSDIYPSISRSRLLKASDNKILGYWRLQQKNPIVPLVLDVQEDETYASVGKGRWICRAYAKDIREVEHAGSPNEKILPLGEGQGFLWRLYGYWSLDPRKGGVLVECRTLSLSRNVPAGLTWLVRPFIQSFPRDSLAATLRDTRAAVRK